jgi:hypothetical protein
LQSFSAELLLSLFWFLPIFVLHRLP